MDCGAPSVNCWFLKNGGECRGDFKGPGIGVKSQTHLKNAKVKHGHLISFVTVLIGAPCKGDRGTPKDPNNRPIAPQYQ